MKKQITSTLAAAVVAASTLSAATVAAPAPARAVCTIEHYYVTDTAGVYAHRVNVQGTWRLADFLKYKYAGEVVSRWSFRFRDGSHTAVWYGGSSGNAYMRTDKLRYAGGQYC